MTQPAPGEAPWLSVLVPAFNVEPYLPQCVDSLMARADEGVEVLLLDDASTDGTAALMRSLQERHPGRIRLLSHEANRGIAAARNTLLDEARGRYVWFVDADDWIDPAALPALRELLRDPAAPDLALFDYAVVRGREKLKHRLRGERHRRGYAGPSGQRVPGGADLAERVLATGNVFVWNHVSLRSLWGDDLRFPVGRSFEDMATTPRLLLRARSAWHVPQPWLRYRRRDDSITSVMSARRVVDLAESLLGLRAELLASEPPVPLSLRVAVAHQNARNLLAAARHAARLPHGMEHELLQRCRRDFRAALGDDLSLLMAHYLQRGWWWRAWRLRRLLSAP